MMGETIIRTEHIYDGKIVKLDLHDVQLPDGQPAKREIIRHPGAVAIVPLDENQYVLMVRQFRLAAGKVMLEIPAGTLNPDEPPEVCAVRELQEEIQHKPNRIESLGGVYTAPGYTTEFIHLFLAIGLEPSTLDGDADEFIEVERIPLKDAVGMVERGEIMDSKTVTGLLWVARKLGI